MYKPAPTRLRTQNISALWFRHQRNLVLVRKLLTKSLTSASHRAAETEILHVVQQRAQLRAHAGLQRGVCSGLAGVFRFYQRYVSVAEIIHKASTSSDSHMWTETQSWSDATSQKCRKLQTHICFTPLKHVRKEFLLPLL